MRWPVFIIVVSPDGAAIVDINDIRPEIITAEKFLFKTNLATLSARPVGTFPTIIIILIVGDTTCGVMYPGEN